ncbi:hypothetical protein FBU31_000873 [Coemansia sp. 'formosensis']|nr:hypothetical protein FBU31_000873 [Coemansia sp. 'formosensis']
MSLRASEVAVHRTGHHIDDLVTRLSKLVGNIDINTYRSRSDLRDLRLEGVHNLVYLELMCHPSSTLNLLAQRNTSTLEFLCISLSNTNGVPGIIQDTDGTYISYPYLATLELRGNTDNANDLPPVFGDYVPFPILRRLIIDCAYPVRDNTLFKGNSATLEHLSMRLSYSIVVILCRHRVFTPESHPKLQYVRVWNASHHVPDIFATNAEALRFILSIGTTAPTRITDIHITGTELTGVMTSLTNLNSIKYLSLAWTAPDLWDTITLIKSLPLLSNLCTGSPKIGTLPDGITLDDLPAYVVSTLAPMGTGLRCWFIMDKVEEDSLKCVLLLALVCPKFRYASTKYVRHELVLPMMEQAIASDMFKPYSPRLQNFKFLGTAIK